MPLTPPQIRLIETWRLGYVATCADNLPNVSPKGTFVVPDPTRIAFMEMRSPKTLSNLQANPIAEVNFVDILTRRGLRISGAATIAARGTSEFDTDRPLFMPLFGYLEAMFGAVVSIAATDIRPLVTPAYEAGASEADLKAHWTRIVTTQ